MTAAEWYEHNKCQHAHCQQCCEHPQPFIARQDDYPNGPWTLYCGRCWFKAGVLSPMIPCFPEKCEEA